MCRAVARVPLHGIDAIIAAYEHKVRAQTQGLCNRNPVVKPKLTGFIVHGSNLHVLLHTDRAAAERQAHFLDLPQNETGVLL